MRWYDFSASSSAGRCPSESVLSAAHCTSSRLGEKNRCSSCAVISGLNRGYAVRSIDVIPNAPHASVPTSTAGVIDRVVLARQLAEEARQRRLPVQFLGRFGDSGSR